jgi:hypothetical protein
MKFHLNHTPKPTPFRLDHQTRFLLLGSCFSENIGQRLERFRFQSLVNPNGVLFNPASVCQCLESALLNQEINGRFILERAGRFYSYHHHTSLSSESADALAEQLNSITSATHRFLKTADVLILSFGTAFAYTHRQLGDTVANCHKQPAHVFDKYMLGIAEIEERYTRLITGLRELNPGLKIIFTVSPVKYLKDGIEENSLSKSTLLLSVRRLTELHPDCFYFPAFELVNDDLRDYRFYKEDLAHPNDQAIEYIWQKFSDCYFGAATRDLNQQILRLNQALAHRPSQAGSQEYQQWLDFIAHRKEELKKLAPGLDF